MDQDDAHLARINPVVMPETLAGEIIDRADGLHAREPTARDHEGEQALPPWGAQVGYVYDQTGRLTDITGSGFGNVTSYASEMRYRAAGETKHLKYGDNRSLDLTYDVRLKLSHYQVSGVAGYPNQQNLAELSYTYDADGRIHSIHNHLDNRFDRVYTYDHMSRITAAKSGIEAGGGGTSVLDSPYKQTYDYDVWNNMTLRTGRRWSKNFPTYSATYVNSRVVGGQYDENGAPTSRGTVQFMYDAAALPVHSLDTIGRGRNAVQVQLYQQYDGDGRRIKQEQVGVATTYYLFSTVMGGAVAEINAQGQKVLGNVYAGGALLAQQSTFLNAPVYQHREPSGSHEFRSFNLADGTLGAGVTQLDPLGDDADTEDPYLDHDGNGIGDGDWAGSYPHMGDISDFGQGCQINGEPWPCDLVMKFAGVMGQGYRINWGDHVPGAGQAQLPTDGYVWRDNWTEYYDPDYPYVVDGQVYHGSVIARNDGYFQVIPGAGPPLGAQLIPRHPVPLDIEKLKENLKTLLSDPDCGFVAKVGFASISRS